MKFNIAISLVVLVAICCCVFAADEAQANLVEKKTEKRGIYSGFGYGGHGHYAPTVISHGHSIGHYGGYGGHYGGGYGGGFGHYPSYVGGFYPSYYGGLGHGYGGSFGHGYGGYGGHGFGHGFGHHF